MKYVRNLAKADNNVMSVSPQTEKSSRPFIGVLILLNGKKYCIPLSSPKKKFEGKKNSVDFMKITHSNEKDNKKIIGAPNINNMLLIDDALIAPIDLKIHNNDSPKSVAYKELMKYQLDFCRHNQDIILKRANKLYDIVVNHPEKTLISLKDVVTLQSLKLFCKNILKN